MDDPVKRGRQLANRLRLPEPWAVEDLCAQVSQRRGRVLQVHNRPAAGDSITAALLSTATADYIFCRDDLHGLHRDHAICHELGHLIAGHVDEPNPDVAVSLGVGTGLSVAPHTVAAILQRNCDYGQALEQEAEAIADAIMQRVSQRVTAPHRDRHTQRVINGFGDALR